MDNSETFLAHYGGQTSLLPPDEHEIWTAEEIEELRSRLLKVSLQQLFDGRESPESRAEALLWFLDDQDAPFSAARCCEAAGDERGVRPTIGALRELVLEKLRREAPLPRAPSSTARQNAQRTESPQESLWVEETLCA